MNRLRSHIHACCLAFRMLSVLPLPYPKNAPHFSDKDGDFCGIAAYLPLLGVVLGGIVALGAVLVERTSPGTTLSYLLVAALVAAALALLTRKMHLDAVADVADAMWGGYTPERRLAILKDTLVGSFGAVAVSLTLAFFILLYALLLEAQIAYALVFVCAVGRFSATCAAWFCTPATGEGLGFTICKKPRVDEVVVVALTLVLATVSLWVSLNVWLPADIIRFWAVVALSLACAFCAPRLIGKAFGGVTGDIMGASIVVTELFAMMMLILVVVW